MVRMPGRFTAAWMIVATVMVTGAISGCATNTPRTTSVDSGVTRVDLGSVNVTMLSDGQGARPLDANFVRNVPLAEVQAALTEAKLPTDRIDVPFNPFVADIGAQRVLFDTGSGEFGAVVSGKLLENMGKAGIDPKSVTAVVISHFHGDHINGLRNKAGELAFAKAKVMVPAAEYAFWMDDAKMAAAPAGQKGAFENARRTFSAMGPDMLVQFAAGAEVVPGIRSVAAYGHTPGHTLFEVTSAGQSFFYLADLTNVPSLFARNPDWAVTFDMDAEAARKVRREVFARVTSSKSLVGGFHFPFPAFGRMTATGNGYTFEPTV